MCSLVLYCRLQNRDRQKHWREVEDEEDLEFSTVLQALVYSSGPAWTLSLDSMKCPDFPKLR